MHPVLRTPELIEEIFSFLPRSSLSVLARTCGSFFHPAACRVWGRCDTLLHLVMCLPTSCWERVDYTPGVVSDGLSLRITRQIAVADTQRLRIYAAFISDFSIFGMEVAVAPSDIAHLAGVMDGGYLLPNLRRFYYHGPRHRSLSAILPLLHPPGLSVLMISLWKSESPSAMDLAGAAEEISALRLLKARGIASITSLSFAIDFGDPRVRLTPWAELLAGWDSLRFLSISDDIDNAALLSIANLPCLHTLTLHNQHEPVPWSVPPQWRSSSTMRSLKLSKSLVASAVAFIHSFQMAPIESLDVIYVQDGVENPIRAICRAVGQSCNVQSLTSVRLTPPDYYSQVAEDGPVHDITEFEPLLSFRRLTSLRIKSHSVLSLRDEDVLRIARALPDLNTLELGGNVWRTPKCTMLSLLHLARYCPCLAYLTLAVDARETRIPEGTPTDVVQQSLILIYVHQSPIASEMAVASFLWRFFPYLMAVIPKGRAGLHEDQGELRRRQLWRRVNQARRSVRRGIQH
ncbi:uncharacterized protein SCHCODRAFT_02644297 [Schizophyllum commune H4-8]|uniref:uncharacterized protein n=1 Tax=Schizophyllum commune (strain H4-8 / FGSC 9210) TaxID=578458 RepID=UPI00215F35F6|nr:uncharacterized protein SCHCODRAFT_02644297 [Schizophyllum commune H4-8]KAI5885278.1 hypothetical protein SCHCODRAFT_02644297 [Schizophyllum commune H4-8]